MDLPTYTNIWRIEKRLYKLYDLRLPMPLPLVQIGVFLGVFVPWIVVLKLIGIPFRGGWILPLYLVPPAILTWMATRPVIEGKRLTELLLSQSRYLAEPRTWCRLTPIREPREVVVEVRVWRRSGDATSSVAAAVRSDRKVRKVRRAERGRRAVAPVRVTPRAAVRPDAGPAYASAPKPLSAHLATLEATSEETAGAVPAALAESPRVVPAARVAERKPAPVSVLGQTAHRWAPPNVREPGGEAAGVSADREQRTVPRPGRPAATPGPQRPPEVPAPEVRSARQPGRQVRERSPGDLTEPEVTRETHGSREREEPVETAENQGSGKRALASGVRRPGASADFWKAIAPPQGHAAPLPAAPSPVDAGSTEVEPADARGPAEAAAASPPAERPSSRRSDPQPVHGEPPHGSRRVEPRRVEPRRVEPRRDERAPDETAHGDLSQGDSGQGDLGHGYSGQGDSGQGGDVGSAVAARDPEWSPESAHAQGEVPEETVEPVAPEQEVVGPVASEQEALGPVAPAREVVEPVASEQEVVGPVTPARGAARAPEATPAAKAPTTRPDIPQVAPATRPDIPMIPGAFGAVNRGPDQPRPADAEPERPVAAETGVGEPAAPSSAPRQPTGRPSSQGAGTPVGSQGSPHSGTERPEPAGSERPHWSKSLARPMQEGQTDALVWPPPGHKRRTSPPKHRRTAPEPAANPVAQPAPPSRPSWAVPPVAPAASSRAEPAPPTAQPPKPPSPVPPSPVPQPPKPQPPVPPSPAQPSQEPVGLPLPPVRPLANSESAQGVARGPAEGPSAPVSPPERDRRTWPAQPPVRGVPPRPQGTPVNAPPPGAAPQTPRPGAGPQRGTPPRPAPPAEERQPAARADWEPPARSSPATPVRPRPLVPPTPPPPPQATITPPDLDEEDAPGGLRRLLQAVGGGHSDLDAVYEERLQRPFQGTRHIVVLGCTGGAGQTVTALMLGHTFAQYCGEPIVAVDVNPGPGALARRTRSETPETLTGLIARADQVHSLTAMRRYTSQAKSGLDVIAAGKNPLQGLDDRDYALAIRTLDRFYSVTMLDAAAAVVARVLPYADQIVLVAPASADAPRAVGMTFEWLDGHGYDELRSRAVTVINGVSRRSMDDVEQAEAVARGQCRALVRIPWDDHLSLDRSPRNELKALRAPTRRAYLALAGVVAGGFTALPERYQEQEQEVGR